MSPHALVQEYINVTEHLYAIVTNGLQLRLLRDSSRLIKLSFMEVDLQAMMEEELFADFAIMYRLLHASRMPQPEHKAFQRYFLTMKKQLDDAGRVADPRQDKELDLDGRLKGYDFGGMTRLAVRDGRDVKKRTKELMTSLINGAMQRKQVDFPAEDVEIEDQFTTHTYTLRDALVIYSKGNDHIIDAIRCAVLIREERNIGVPDEQLVSLKSLATEPFSI